jgi:hypothetical protein
MRRYPAGRVLGGQAQDQGPDTGGDGGSTSADGFCGPTAGDELSVPAQVRGRCDQQPESATGGYKPGEGGDHGSVGPPHTGAVACVVAAQPPDAADEDLDLFRRVGPGRQHHLAQELREHLVDQRQRHRRIMPGHPRLRTGRSTGVRRISGTHRVWNPPMPLLFQRRFGIAPRHPRRHPPRVDQRGARRGRGHRRRRAAAGVHPARLPPHVHHRRRPPPASSSWWRAARARGEGALRRGGKQARKRLHVAA